MTRVVARYCADGRLDAHIQELIALYRHKRDVMLEEFQTHYHPGASGSVSETALEQGDDELDADEDGQDPGRED